MASSAQTASRRESKKAANREAILFAGRRVFVEVGFAASTIRDIVRESGLSPGTFYNYFDSKEEVMRELIRELAAAVRSRIREARRRATTSRSFIEDAYLAYFEAVAEDRLNLQMLARNQDIFRALVFSGTGAKNKKDAAAIQGIVSELAADLEGAIKAGLFPDIDVRLATHAIIGAGFELLVQMAAASESKKKAQAIAPKDAARFLAGLFVGGLPATV